MNFKNSSLSVLQSVRIRFRSPTRISLAGTVTNVPLRSSVTSLPFCLTFTKPNSLQRILISSLPSTVLSETKCVQNSATSDKSCDFFGRLLPDYGEMKIKGFSEVPFGFGQRSPYRVNAQGGVNRR